MMRPARAPAGPARATGRCRRSASPRRPLAPRRPAVAENPAPPPKRGARRERVLPGDASDGRQRRLWRWLRSRWLRGSRWSPLLSLPLPFSSSGGLRRKCSSAGREPRRCPHRTRPGFGCHSQDSGAGNDDGDRRTGSPGYGAPTAARRGTRGHSIRTIPAPLSGASLLATIIRPSKGRPHLAPRAGAQRNLGLPVAVVPLPPTSTPNRNLVILVTACSRRSRCAGSRWPQR